MAGFFIRNGKFPTSRFYFVSETVVLFGSVTRIVRDG